MSMDYVTALLQNKRRGEGDHGQWECQSKRVCVGLEKGAQVEYGAVTNHQVDPWEPLRVSRPNVNHTDHHITKPVLAAQGGSGPQCCSRCFAGEPGHINHITQRY